MDQESFIEELKNKLKRSEEELKRSEEKRLKSEEKSKNLTLENEKLKNEAVLHQAQYLSSAIVLQNFMERSSSIENLPILLNSELNSSNIDFIWKQVYNEKIKSKFKIFDPEPSSYDFFKELLESIIEKLKLNYKVTCQCRSLRNPINIPDFIIHSKNITQPNWLDISMIIEIKKPSIKDKKEGAKDAIAYLSAQQLLYKDKHLVMPLISIYTNGLEGQIFIHYDNQNYRSDSLIFLPEPDQDFTDSDSIPSTPLFFNYLSKLLLVISKISRPTEIIIDGINYPIKQTFTDTGIDKVVECLDEDGSKIIIKTMNFSASNYSEREHKSIQLIEGKMRMVSSDFNLIKIKPLYDKGLLKGIKISTIGDTLDSIFKLRELDDKSLLNVSKNCFIQLFELFKLGFVHGDIRPANIIYVDDEEKIFFIDFQTLCRKTDYFMGRFMNNILFASDRLVTFKDEPIEFQQIDDLESLIFTLMVCRYGKNHKNNSRIPWVKDLNQIVELRREFIDLIPENYQNDKLMMIFYDIYKLSCKEKGPKVTKEIREEILNIFDKAII
jgi:hypothetical protein